MNTQEIEIDTIEIHKIAVLAKHLNTEPESITVSRHDECLFEDCNAEYLVLTDDEADERAKEYIKETVWAFNASFLVNYLPEGIDEDVIKVLQEKCESSNEAFIKMIGNQFDEFVEDAISADGRGHFMNSYDGEEYKQDEYFIYRTN